jgi:hypothetical protein
MNITQLRDAINTLLTDSPSLLGTYTLPNNTTTPAIYVVGRQSVPSDWKVTGLEVTMREFPERLPTTMMGTVRVLQQWEVVMMQYTPSSTTLSDAIDRMVRRFPDATVRYFPGDDVAYERCRFIIPDMVVRNLYPAI